jgi:hypothetical protein
MFTIEIFHDQLTEYKLFVNEQLISEGMCNRTVELSVPESLVSIWFYPWKIVPTIRINNFIVNTGLAEIDLYDHKLDVELTNDFYQKYHQNDIASRMDLFYQTDNGKNNEQLFDEIIGFNDHNDVVKQIKKVLDVR